MLEKYNPESYTNRIKDIMKEALSNGIRVDINEKGLLVENTISKDVSIIDMKTLWKSK